MKSLVLLAAAALTSGAAVAQTKSQFYGGFEYGVSRVPDETYELASSLVSSFGGRATVSQNLSVGTGRAFLGYRVNDSVSVEAGLFASSKIKYDISGVSRFGSSYTGSANVDFTGVDIAAVWYPAVKSPGFEGLFLKAGVHSSKYSTSTNFRGLGSSSSGTSDESGTGTLYGAGYDWKFGASSTLRGAITQYQRIGGSSDAKGTFYSIGIATNF